MINNKFNKYLSFLLVLFLPVATFGAKIHETTRLSTKGLLGGVQDLLLSVVGGVAVLFIVIGGLQYVLASGNEKQAENGKKTLTYAVIGLIIVILARIIFYIISEFTTSLF